MVARWAVSFAEAVESAGSGPYQVCFTEEDGKAVEYLGPVRTERQRIKVGALLLPSLDG